MTTEQAAEYLQVDRETIYGYIRQGRLLASKLGRGYRIPRRSLDQLLLATRARPDIPVREYDDDAIARFIERDRLSPEAEDVVRSFDKSVA